MRHCIAEYTPHTWDVCPHLQTWSLPRARPCCTFWVRESDFLHSPTIISIDCDVESWVPREQMSTNWWATRRPSSHWSSPPLPWHGAKYSGLKLFAFRSPSSSVVVMFILLGQTASSAMRIAGSIHNKYKWMWSAFSEVWVMPHAIKLYCFKDNYSGFATTKAR